MPRPYRARLLPALLPIAFALSGDGVVGQDVEEIVSFEVSIDVRPGGRMHVRESITVRALGHEIRRGIYRDFPTSFPRASGFGRIEAPFEVVDVTRDGSAEPYELIAIGGPAGRGGVRVRIGRPDVLLEHGLHTYDVTYETDRWVVFGDSRDQLYWNVTGNGWAFPIRSAAARIRLEGVESPPQLEAWTGPEGSTEGAAETGWDPATRSAVFATTQPLRVGEGLTVRISVPSGALEPPSAEQREAWFAQDWGGYVEAGYVVLLVLAVYLLMWRRVGVDPPPGPTTPRREPPAGFSPAALGYLEHRGYEMSHLAATLVGMAVKGAIRLEQDADEWRVLAADRQVDLEPEERAVYDALLGNRRSISLRQSEHARLGAAVKALAARLSRRLEHVYFENNRRWFFAGLAVSVGGLLVLAWRWRFGIEPTALFLCVWLTGWTAGVLALGSQVVRTFRAARAGAPGGWVGFVAVSAFATPFFAAEIGVTAFLFAMMPAHLLLAAIAVGATNVAFYHLLERPTLRGRGVLDHLDGFRAYLSGSAERRRLGAADDSAVFERYLPHAIALGLERRWAEWFGGGPQLDPATGSPHVPWSWYDPGSGAHPPVTDLASSLGSSLASTLSSASAPPSSGGSSGGGGGGGSSGGGGGGGGGGGW